MKIFQKIKESLKHRVSIDKTDDFDERESMIEGISELSHTMVKEVMVPRIDVVFIADTISLEQLHEVITTEGYSRYPVYSDTIDNVVGILYVKDIIAADSHDGFDVKRVMRKPYFVPDTKRLDELLREFKKRRLHIAVAIDEYGGVSGIVTMEDVLEVIVGEIQDEFDEEEADDIVEIGQDVYMCDARTNISDINERLGLAIPEDDFETLGGFVFEQFGRIPRSQEKISYHDADFIVQEINGHKINRVKIILKRP